MCGICGIINFEGASHIDKEELIEMRDTMIHRGPDDAGIFIKNNIGLGHRRLSILDLSANGRQPMSNKTEDIWITYNGEFYNYQEYIPYLKNRGYQFKSGNDTEVILYLYEEFGLEETLDRMTGMFAFCLTDLKKNIHYLVRDRFGIKPLYYTINRERLAFASEIKAFYALHDYKPELINESIPEYYFYSRNLDYSTLLKDTFEVKPGTYIEIKNSNLHKYEYYNVANIKENTNITEEEAIDEIDRLLTDAVKSQLVSDVPVGVFLSGGLDSSIIALKMSELCDIPINTISAGYKEKEANEFVWSNQVVKRINSNHRNFLDNSKDFFSLLPFLTYINDTPLVTGVSFYKAAKFAKENCTVMLCGQGSDEILGGYTGYLFAEKQQTLNKLTQKIWGKKVNSTLSNYLSSMGKRKIFRKVAARLTLNEFEIAGAYVGTIPKEDILKIFTINEKDYYELLGLYNQLWPQGTNRDFLFKMLCSEMYRGLQTITQNTDRMTMAASVEARVPFLDHHLVEFIFSLPTKLKVRNNQGKYILKRYLLHYFDKSFIYRPKKGFPVPLTQWFLNDEFNLPTEMNPLLSSIINKDYLNTYGKLVKSGILGRNSDAVTPILRLVALNNWIYTVPGLDKEKT